MKHYSKGILDTLLLTINSSPTIPSVTRIGLCRMWVREAILAIGRTVFDQCIAVVCEAREVELEPGVSHTFLYVWVTDSESTYRFILDGVGTASHPPYFGLADDAPAHLLGNHIDMIERYRKIGAWDDRFDPDWTVVSDSADE